MRGLDFQGVWLGGGMLLYTTDDRGEGGDGLKSLIGGGEEAAVRN